MKETNEQIRERLIKEWLDQDNTILEIIEDDLDY